MLNTLCLVAFYFCLIFDVSQGKGSKVVDLSHVFDDTTIYLNDRLKVTLLHNETTYDYWHHDEKFCTATHGGTHMDAPCVFNIDGWCISDIPHERFILPAVVIDISDKVRDDASRNLLKEDILEWEEHHGPVPNASLLLVRTDWSKKWSNFRYYTGIEEGGDVMETKFPSIDAGAAEYIVENTGVYGVGIDSLSLGIPHNSTDAHVVIMMANIYGLENLKDLHLLPTTGATVFALPMKLGGASGAPCRVMAQLP